MSVIVTTEPLWVHEEAALAIHQRQLAEHGGLGGVRDAGLLSSALHRPQHLYHYTPDCRLADLAAAYGYGLAKNHPFLDGNKRTALALTDLFLILNGFEMGSPPAENYTTIMALAGGELEEAAFAAWLAAPLIPRV